MRIMYVAQSTLPTRLANSINVVKMCQAFAHHGHEVTLLAHKAEPDTDARSIYDYYGVDSIFRLNLMHLPPIRGAFALRAFIIYRELRRHKPDLVYTRDVWAAKIASLLGLQVYFELHHPMANMKWPYGAMFRSLLGGARVTRWIVITHALKDYLREAHPSLPHSSIIVAPDGADLVRVQSAKALGDSSRLQVGYTGSLYPGKGMEVISELARSVQRADFHVVGGPKQSVERWIEHCRDLPNMFFHGQVPHSAVPEYLAAFDVALLPNQERVMASGQDIGRWTSPLKAFEYAAAGLAIVASDLPVLQEILRHGENALMCPPDDIACWRASIEALSADRELRTRLGNRAKTEFIASYTWHARARRILAQV